MFNLCCEKCRNVFGPMVGNMLVISVCGNNYVAEQVLAVQCDRCGHVQGTIPKPMVGEVAQEFRCPECNKKAGELSPSFAAVQSGGRGLWARHVKRVQCRCGCDWEPKYAAPEPEGGVLTARPRRPRPSPGTRFSTAGVTETLSPCKAA